MIEEYDDIIDLPHWEPRRHARMPLSARAAQFAPFAALNGHEEAIAETARHTVQPRDLGDDDMRELDRRLSELLPHLGECPEVEVVYFAPDLRKQGGAYRHVRGRLKTIDDTERSLVFTEGWILPLSQVVDLRPL